MFGLGELSPVLFLFCEAGGVVDVVVAPEGDVAVDADEGCGPAPPEGVLLDLLLLERDIAVDADKRNHC